MALRPGIERHHRGGAGRRRRDDGQLSGLPPAWRIELDRDTRRIDDGRVLVGGAPLRLLRLNEAAALVVDHLVAGGEVGTGSGTQAMARRLLDAGLAQPLPSATARTAQDVTIVVPHFGDPGELALTLAALGPAARTIVVDDASPDRGGVAAVAARWGADLVHLDGNSGPAAARNAGWRRATTELVAFVDRGCAPAVGWLDVLLPHLDDPVVAIAAPRITSIVDAGLGAALAAYEQARPSLDRGPDEAMVRPRGRVPFVPSTALLVRRTDLDEVDGFDEALRVGEDVDLVWRLVERGRTVRYVPAAIVAHGSRTSAGGWLRQRFDYGTSAATLTARHGAAVAPLAVNPWTAAAWGLDAMGAPLLGTLVAAGSTAALAPKLHGLAHPWQEAWHLAGLGHVHGGRAIADALRRPWWPLAASAALVSRRARRVVVTAAIVPPLLEWWQDRPALDPVRWTALRLADDVAYGTGVWAGCWRARSFAALRPDLTSWPGRKPAVEAAASSES